MSCSFHHLLLHLMPPETLAAASLDVHLLLVQNKEVNCNVETESQKKKTSTLCFVMLLSSKKIVARRKWCSRRCSSNWRHIVQRWRNTCSSRWRCWWSCHHRPVYIIRCIRVSSASLVLSAQQIGTLCFFMRTSRHMLFPSQRMAQFYAAPVGLGSVENAVFVVISAADMRWM